MKKCLKILFSILLPFACFFTVCAFCVNVMVYNVTLATTEYGGFAFVDNYVLQLNSGTNIKNYSVTRSGGAVYVNSQGLVSFEGATISNCSAEGYGGAICLEDGSATLKMGSGTISNNSSGTYGGAISIGASGTFDLYGGTISKNTSKNGGGVYLDGSSSFTMYGGTITENICLNGGAGVYVDGAYFVIDGGEISGNVSSNAPEKADIYCGDKQSQILLMGGTVGYVYSESDVVINSDFTLKNQITIGNEAKVVVAGYDKNKTYNIKLLSGRGSGIIITFGGDYVDQPSIDNFIITGYDQDVDSLYTVKNADGTWSVVVDKASVEFPTTWKTELADTSRMTFEGTTTTVAPATITSLKILSSVPSGYTQIGTLSSGIGVYKGSSATDIAFVDYRVVKAPTSMDNLFASLSKLETLEIDNLHTENTTSMNKAFYANPLLKTITFNKTNFDTSAVTNMYMMFNGDTVLSSLDLSFFDTSNVEIMGSMFLGCSGLKSLNVSSFNTAKVLNMGAMFQGCSSLTSLDISSFNTERVTIIGGMFYNCSSLTSLDVTGFNTSKVTSLGSLFRNCTSLTSLDVSSFNTENVISMAYMFSGCAFTTINLSNFNTSKVSSFANMFENCKQLTSIDLSNFDTSSATSMSSMFSVCSKLKTLDLSSFNTAKVTNMSYMFQNCSSLTSLNISSFNTTNVTNMACMFSSCSKLTELDLSNFNTSNVTNMAFMFQVCTNLTLLNVSSFNTAKVTTMRCMFYMCSSVIDLDVSGFNTQAVTSTAMMFFGCKGLTSLDTSSFDTSKVTDMSYMFGSCTGLTSLNVSSLTATSATDMSYMFQNCSRLKKLDINNLTTTNTSIDFTSMFQDCNSLEYLYAKGLEIYSGATITDMFNFGSSNKIKFIEAPKRIQQEIPVTSGNTIYKYKKPTAVTGLQVATSSNVYTSDQIEKVLPSNWKNQIGSTTYMTTTIDYSKITVLQIISSAPSGFTKVGTLSSGIEVYRGTTTPTYVALVATNVIIPPSDSTAIANEGKPDWSTTCDRLFSGMVSLKTVILSNFSTITTINTENMFYNDYNVAQLVLQKLNLYHVEKFEGMFNFYTQNLGDIAGLSQIYTPYNAPNDIPIDSMKVLTDDNNTVYNCVPKGRESLHLCVDNYTDESKTILPAGWFDEIISQNLTSGSKIYSIKFTNQKPSGTSLSTLSTGIQIYQDTDWYSSNQTFGIILYSPNTIYAPADSSYLFARKYTINSTSYNLQTLKNITFGNFDTSDVYNMQGMFKDLYSLTSLDLSMFDTSKVTDMSSMFEYCSCLKTLDFSNFDTSKVTTMAAMFEDCSSLTSLDLSMFDTSNVTSMRFMFCECKLLETLDVSNFNTSKVTDMSSMFEYCNALSSMNTNVNSLRFDTSKVKDMSRMFVGCITLQTLDLRSFSSEVLENTSEMFMHCISLENIMFSSNFTVESVGNMIGMFAECAELKTLNLSNFHPISCQDFSYMFSSCASLVSVDLSNFNTQNAENMECMFLGCESLKTLDLTAFDTLFVFKMLQMFAGCLKLEEINLSSFNTSKVENMAYMFKDCRNLTVLSLSNFTGDNLMDTTAMFSGCVNLAYLNLRKLDMSQVTGAAGMFEFGSLAMAYFRTPYNNTMELPFSTQNTLFDIFDRDTTYTSVPAGTTGLTLKCESKNIMEGDLNKTLYTLSQEMGINPDDILEVEFWFGDYGTYAKDNNLSIYVNNEIYTNTYLTYVLLDPDNSKQGKVVISAPFFMDMGTSMASLFIDLSGLKKVDFGRFVITSDVKTMNRMFLSCTSLEEVDLTYLSTDSLTDMQCMFANCESLTSVDLSNWEMWGVQDISNCFDNCINLQTVIFPRTGGSLVDMSYMFNKCFKLTSVDLTNTTTSNVTNMSGMFGGCESLIELDLSSFDTSNVTDFSYMFSGCVSLKKLNISSFDMRNDHNSTYVFDFGDENAILCIKVPEYIGNDYSINTSSKLTFSITGETMSSMPGWHEYGGIEAILFSKENYVKFLPNEKWKNYLEEVGEDPYIIKEISFEFTVPSSEYSLLINDLGETGIQVYITQDKTKIAFVSSLPIFADEDCSDMFTGAYLEKVTFNNFNTITAKTMSYMFAKCYSLKSVDFKFLDLSGVQDFSYMFHQCYNLETADFTSVPARSGTDFTSMFELCYSLRYLYMGSFSMSSATKYDWMYAFQDGADNNRNLIYTLITPKNHPELAVKTYSKLYYSDGTLFDGTIPQGDESITLKNYYISSSSQSASLIVPVNTLSKESQEKNNIYFFNSYTLPEKGFIIKLDKTKKSA